MCRYAAPSFLATEVPSVIGHAAIRARSPARMVASFGRSDASRVAICTYSSGVSATKSAISRFDSSIKPWREWYQCFADGHVELFDGSVLTADPAATSYVVLDPMSGRYLP